MHNNSQQRNSLDKKGLIAAVEGVIDRKELLRKEYNRMIETRLPNIYTMMSQFTDKNVSKVQELDSVNNTSASIVSTGDKKTIEYDDTQLLKYVLFSKGGGAGDASKT